MNLSGVDPVPKKQKSIADLETEIRDFINHPRTQDTLLADFGSWNTLCSALDVIGDTELALDAYRNWKRLDEDGERYLLVYGVLQVMEVQQDAVEYICKSLGMAYLRPKELTGIRIIRNDAIGHAMERKENGVYKANLIQRYDLSQNVFTLLTVFADRRDYIRRQVHVMQLLGTQRKFIAQKMQGIVDNLRNDEMKHRAKHKDEKLQDIFPDTLHYIFQKIFEMSPLSGPCLKDIKARLARFRAALETRNEWREDGGLSYAFNLAVYPADQLEQFFDARQDSKLNDQDAYIFISFLKAQIDQLREMARQLDEEYAADA